jgi:uncharacterized protein DUF6916
VLKVSRGTFLRSCGMAFLGAGLDVRPLSAAAAVFTNESASIGHAAPFHLQDATARVFLPHVHTSFTVRAADGTVAPFVLEHVVERRVVKNVEQFSLIFHAAAGTTIADGTHAFRHPTLGDFDLFIVPVGASNSECRRYQACFSRHQRT